MQSQHNARLERERSAYYPKRRTYVKMPDMRSFLIIGQGIAGSLLAWHLSKAGHAVSIVDRGHKDSSSMVAAGLVNPITGQRLALTPRFDLFAQHAQESYTSISAELGDVFFVPKPILRVLRSAQEQERARQLIQHPDSSAYALRLDAPGTHKEALHDPFGSLVIAGGGHLRTRAFLEALKSYFTDKGMLICEGIDHSDIGLHQEYIDWKGRRFDAVICCEGFAAKDNPWFKDLPYNLAKGEILKATINSDRLPDAIICQQQWLLPDTNGIYWAGSSYDRDNINTQPTPEGEAAIFKGVRDFLRAEIRIIERYAGVRPVMIDQKPVVEMHPSIARVGIFNGFASKGILWAPYYARQFAQTLSQQP